MFQNNLSQLVHSPTHLKGNILDLILTNSDELISNVEVIPPHHSLSSDHYIISFQLSLLKSVTPRQKPRYVFNFPKANLTGLCNFLLDFDLSSCLASVNIEYVWSAIKQAIYTGMNLFNRIFWNSSFLPQTVLIQFHIWTWLLVVCRENSLSSSEVY